MEALVLCRLKHRNVLEFIGLYRQQREEFELTFIITPWMTNGDVELFMEEMTDPKASIPRIQWVSTVAHPYEDQLICFAPDLRDRPRPQILA